MRLPSYLTLLSPVGETLASAERELERLSQDTKERNSQLSVSTAQSGLSLWEQDYALSSAGDVEVRRARIRSALAGGQTLTKVALEQLAVTVGGADAGEATEDFGAYHVTLYALYAFDLPQSLSALEEAVARLKPAHLSVRIVPAIKARGSIERYSALTGKAHLLLHSRTDT